MGKFSRNEQKKNTVKKNNLIFCSQHIEKGFNWEGSGLWAREYENKNKKLSIIHPYISLAICREGGGYQVFPFLPSDTRDGKYFSFGHSIKSDMRQCQRKGNILSRES